MNAPRKLVLIISAAAIALPQIAYAQSAELSKSWSGTWRLNKAKSKFSSAEFTPKSDSRNYAIEGKRVTMRSIMVNAAGKTIKWGFTANTDGKWYRTNGNPNNDHIALTYVGPRELKSKTTLKDKPSGRATATVSADGKVLTIKRSILIAKGGPTNDTLVYERAK